MHVKLSTIRRKRRFKPRPQERYRGKYTVPVIGQGIDNLLQLRITDPLVVFLIVSRRDSTVHGAQRRFKFFLRHKAAHGLVELFEDFVSGAVAGGRALKFHSQAVGGVSGGRLDWVRLGWVSLCSWVGLSKIGAVHRYVKVKRKEKKRGGKGKKRWRREGDEKRRGEERGRGEERNRGGDKEERRKMRGDAGKCKREE
jgi:hypothetical protein